MPRDLSTFLKYRSWARTRRLCHQKWHYITQARRYAPFRRTGPAPQWHPDGYAQPGEVE